MAHALALDDDRLFPGEAATRAIARRLFRSIEKLPIVSPHGHADAGWFARNQPFANPTALLVTPDRPLLRMLRSQGVALPDLGVDPREAPSAAASRQAWRLFASHYALLRGTPSYLWLNHVFATVFGLDVLLEEPTADRYFDHISRALARRAFRPRALLERFNIEVLATAQAPTDRLASHEAIRASGWKGRVIPTYRPDPVVDPEHERFAASLAELGELTGEDVLTWEGYLRAHLRRRQVFGLHGATATEHGHPTARTADLSEPQCRQLFARVAAGRFTQEDAEIFRAQMLTEMARMSLEDGLVMQIHPGAWRSHNAQQGRDPRADIPGATDYVRALKPLLDRFGNEPRLTLIVFTLDETAYSRELAPLAGHYPALRLGPPGWLHDSPEGLMRYRELTTATAGFYNTVGFNDDSGAFLLIPARHDVARRVDCAFLARLVAEHRLGEEEAHHIAADLAYHLPKQAYRL